MPATDASLLRVSEFLLPPSETIVFALTSQQQQQQGGLEEIAFTTEAILTFKRPRVVDARGVQQKTAYKAIDRFDYASFQFSPVEFKDLGHRCFDISFRTEPYSQDGNSSFWVRMRDEATAKTYYKALVALLREATRDFFDSTRTLNFH